ncbi:MAG TPA: hypothetical protein VNL69_02425 [Bacteroidota bacterium]|nr:hypothetical protein [Bacteroidota bacterium]
MRALRATIIAGLFIGMTQAMAQEEPTIGLRPFAQPNIYRTFDIRRYEKNLEQSLAHPMPVIVESALAQVTMLKLAQPDVVTKSWEKRIADLVLQGGSPAVRYKAHLAMMVFLQPQAFASSFRADYRTTDEFFIALADRMKDIAFETQ